MCAQISPKIIENTLQTLKFNDQGLIPAIAQQHDTGEILMMAWMNKDAVVDTLTTGRICYFSRSRGKLWRKGESSGQIQNLVDFRFDCDADTILITVDQIGVACHTGRRNCFYKQVSADGIIEISEVLTDPRELYSK